jgi:hypothetical protein
MRSTAAGLVALMVAAAGPPTLAAPAPMAFGAGDRALVLQVHGEGAQIYECKADAAGHLAWSFREPIATLIKDRQTVGRHYAGPHWELNDGALVRGTLVTSQPGQTPDDIPWLKLDVAENKGVGALANATLVLRLNTHGGVLTGDCPAAGALRSVPYAADYVFLR